MTVEVPVAVYFAYEDKELSKIYDDIKTAVTSDQAGSAFEGNKFCIFRSGKERQKMHNKSCW